MAVSGAWDSHSTASLLLVLLSLMYCVDFTFPQMTLSVATVTSASMTTPAPWNTTCPRKCRCFLSSRYYYTSGHGEMSSSSDEHDGSAQSTVDCSNGKLQSVPANLPTETQRLLLKGNVVRTMPVENPQVFTHLLHIDLSYNGLTSLLANSIGSATVSLNLANLTHLESLNLANNRLTSLATGCFRGLKNVLQLTLDNNNIATIETNVFVSMTKIQTLSLSGNKLTSLSWLKSNGLSNLQKLIMEDNLLQSLHPGRLLEELHGLTSLFLAKNTLSDLDSASFSGLVNLRTLDLCLNNITRVLPSSFRGLTRLDRLALDGNPIEMLSYGDFVDLSVSELSLSSMPALLSVDRGALQDMDNLTVLQLHNNKRLCYMDPRAIKNAPHLQEIHLHGNNMKGVPGDLLHFLPSLTTVSFYDNPLLCDCNVYWIKEMIVHRESVELNATTLGGSESENGSYSATAGFTFTQGDKLVCKGPEELAGRQLKNVPLSKIAQTCPPTVIPLFNNTYQRELGSSMTFQCRALGVPTPHIHWVMSNGKVVNNTSNYSRVKLDKVGRLTVSHLKASDAGTYTCVATNAEDFVTHQTVLHIHSSHIHILHKGIATNFVTVTWNGTESTVGTSSYVILYRQLGTTDPYLKIHLHRSMRTYTITKLKPETVYQFCIAYEAHGKANKLNCLNIKTKHRMFVAAGIHTISNLTVLIALSLVCTFIIFICVLMVVVRRWRRRKAYNEPDGTVIAPNTPTTSANAVGHSKVSHLSQIPLDNIYHPPSTPLCTSRTSLISQSTLSNMSTA